MSHERSVARRQARSGEVVSARHSGLTQVFVVLNGRIVTFVPSKQGFRDEPRRSCFVLHIAYRIGLTCGYVALATVCYAQVSISAKGAAQRRGTFRTQAEVSIVVTDKNPFVYKYRTTINEATVQETAPLAFIAQLSPLLAAVTTPTAVASGATVPLSIAPSRIGLQPTDTCKGETLPKATAALRRLSDDRDELKKLEEVAESSARDLETSYVSAKKTFDTLRMDLRDRAAKTVDLRAAAKSFAAAFAPGGVAGYPKPAVIDTADTQLKSVQTAAKELIAAIDDFRQSYPDCQPIQNGRNGLIAERIYAESLATWWFDERKSIINTVRKGIDSIDAINAAIEKAEREGAYEETHIIGNYATPTVVTVTVDRWPIDDADEKNKETVAKGIFDFGGGARFLLSGGLGFVQGLTLRQYQQVRGYERDKSGQIVKDELTTVVGLKREDTHLIVPALLLNTRLWRFTNNASPVQSVFVSTGVTAQKNNDVDVDYLAGVSVGILGDRVMVTAAVFYGKEEMLAGDLYSGAKIPDTVTSIPVRKEYKRGGIVLISYRIK